MISRDPTGLSHNWRNHPYCEEGRDGRRWKVGNSDGIERVYFEFAAFRKSDSPKISSKMSSKKCRKFMERDEFRSVA